MVSLLNPPERPTHRAVAAPRALGAASRDVRMGSWHRTQAANTSQMVAHSLRLAEETAEAYPEVLASFRELLGPEVLSSGQLRGRAKGATSIAEKILRLPTKHHLLPFLPRLEPQPQVHNPSWHLVKHTIRDAVGFTVVGSADTLDRLVHRLTLGLSERLPLKARWELLEVENYAGRDIPPYFRPDQMQLLRQHLSLDPRKTFTVPPDLQEKASGYTTAQLTLLCTLPPQTPAGSPRPVYVELQLRGPHVDQFYQWEHEQRYTRRELKYVRPLYRPFRKAWVLLCRWLGIEAKVQLAQTHAAYLKARQQELAPHRGHAVVPQAAPQPGLSASHPDPL